MALADGISFAAASGGTGSFVFAAARPSFLTLAQAVTLGELADGQTVSYLAQDSLTTPTQREWGHGTFSASGNLVARTTVLGTVNSNGVAGSASPLSFSVPPVVSLTVLAEDISSGGSGNTISLIADTAIAAGTSVSLNANGHVQQTWGPAPNIAGIVNLFNAPMTAWPTGSFAPNVLVSQLSSSLFIAAAPFASNNEWAINSFSISGSTITAGTVNSNPPFQSVPAVYTSSPLGSATFLFYYVDDSFNNSLVVGSVSAGAISFGTPAVVSSATGQSPATGVAPTLINLSSTSFAFVFQESGGIYGVIGTVSGTTITLGTPVQITSNNSDVVSVYALSSSAALFVYADQNSSSNATAVVGSVSGTTLTLGTPAAISSVAADAINPVIAGVLTSTSFVLAWAQTSYNSYVVAASISGATITFGTPEFVGMGPSSTNLVISVLSSSTVAVGPFGTTPTLVAISGTTVTPTLGSPVPVSWFGGQGFQDSVIPLASTMLFPNIAPISSTEFIWEDGNWSLYEETSAGVISPPIKHQGLSAYALYPLTSSTVLAVIFDYGLNFLVRVININPIAVSGPVGFVTQDYSEGGTATVQTSGLASGFSDLSPGVPYYHNGDGTITTGNTGMKAGVAVSTNELLIAV